MEIVGKMGGEVKSVNVQNTKEGIKMTCELKHKFSLSLEELEEGIWCRVCDKKYNKYVKELKKKNTSFVSLHLRNKVVLKCPNDHIYNCHVRGILKRTCPVCIKFEKKQLKEFWRKKQQEHEQ